MTKTNRAAAPLHSKIAWGMGGLPEMLANNAILVLVYQIYNIELGLNPMWIGVALAISRVLDAITDPLMGNLTDNTRTKWGRRRPWIFVGAVLMSIFFAMIWLIPTGLGQMGLFAWFAATTVLFYIGFTIFIIPFGALGLELELDYDLRTKLQVFRLVPSFAGGFVLPWLYKITLADCFEHETLATAVNGVRYVGIGVALVTLLFALPSALFTKERFAEQKQEKIRILEAVKYTFSDIPYLRILVYTFMVFLGLFFVNPLLNYINIFYINGGDKELAAQIGGVAGTVGAACSLVALFVLGRIAHRVDKKTVVFISLTVAALGYASSWFCFTPANPWLMMVPLLVSQVGLCGCWVIGGSICADVCDHDELKTGKRREGMYSAVGGFVYKATLALVAVMSGMILNWAGVREGEVTALSMDIINKLRIMYVVVPVTAFGLGIWVMIKYPLTKKRMLDIQRQLEERRGVPSA